MGVAELHPVLPRGLRVCVEATRRIDVYGEPVDRRCVSGPKVDQGLERAYGGGATENVRNLRLKTSNLVNVGHQLDQQARSRAEVGVDGLPGDARSARDLLQRDGDEALVLEQPAGGLRMAIRAGRERLDTSAIRSVSLHV